MWVRGLGWERIPRGLRRRSNRGDSFSPPSVLAAEMMSACGEHGKPRKINFQRLTPTDLVIAPRAQACTKLGRVQAK